MSDIYQNPRELKYVVLSSAEVILLNASLSHNDVTGCLGKGGLGPHPSPGPFPIGAGTCRVYWQDGKWMVSCHGESITLHVKSQGQKDAHHIENALAKPMNYKVFRTERPVIFSGSLPHKAVGSDNVCGESQGTCTLAYDEKNQSVQPTPTLTNKDQSLVGKQHKKTDTDILTRTFNETRW